MKTAKRILAILLTVIMLLSTVPMNVFAKETTEPQADSDTETTITAESGLGKILNNLTQTNVDITNNNYVISDVKVDGKIANVEVSSISDCKIVVAIYDEDTNQMLASGMTDVTVPEEQTEEADAFNEAVKVEIDTVQMPEHYLIKAFMLDENLAALTNAYTYYEHTEIYEKFIETTPDDFDEDCVVPLSDNEEEDFGALTDDVIKVQENASMTIEYDSTTGSYTFKNATDEIKGISVGEILYYEDENDFVLLKVKSVKVSGTTVSITEDEDISIEEAFEYIRLDEYADFSTIDDEDIETGSCIDRDDTITTASVESQYISDENAIMTASSDDYGDEIENEKTLFNDSFKVSYPKSESDDEHAWKKGWKLSGSVNVKITSGTRLHWDARWGKDYYEFKTDVKISFDIDFSVTGTISLNKNKVKIDLAGKKGIPVGKLFRLYISLYPIAELSGTIDILKVNIVSHTWTNVNSDDGLKKESSTTKSVKDSKLLEATITVKLGVGVDFDLGRKWGKKDKSGNEKIKGVVTVSVQGYFSGTFTPFNLVHTLVDAHHDCVYCITGVLKGTIEGTVSITLKLFKIIDTKWDLVKLGKTWTLGKGYFSVSSRGIEIGWGDCPHIQKGVTVYVKDNSADNKPLKDAKVTSNTGYCCADNDGKYNDRSYTTGEDGAAKFYFPVGTHKISVKYNGVTKRTEIIVTINDKEITFFYDDGTVGNSKSDGTGSNDSVFTGTEVTGTIINFGSYPQSKVADSSLIEKLEKQSKIWESYEYYSGTGSWSDGNMEPSDYMQYADFKYDGDKYRAVTFSKYRPYRTGYTSSASYTYQDDNGYYTNNVYYFKYEPLQWRVLDASEGLVMCNNAIDSQAYNNYILYDSSSIENYGDSAKSYYASDWANSSLREWLNDDFYNTAFSSAQQSRIETTNLETKSTYNSKYDSTDTTDKVFLLSYWDVMNTSYGFSSSYNSSSTREIKSTDYAQSQGCYKDTSTSYYGNSWWWLRSPYHSSYATEVSSGGNAVNNDYVGIADAGVVPALNLKKSTIKKSTIANLIVTASYEIKTEGEKISVAYSACEAGGEYILLNVLGYGEDFGLTNDKLLFIDQLTADENGSINKNFIPKYKDENSITLLIGDFGNGIEAKELKEHTHSYTSKVTDPTCTEKGYTTHICSVCNDSYVDTYVDAKGHKASDWIIDKAAQPGVEGSKHTECTICHTVLETAKIPALPQTNPSIKAVSIGDITLNYKKSANLNPSITADSGAKYTVKYSSDNTKVATVDENGNVYAAKKGTATITCTVTDSYGNTVSDTCNVKVKYSFGQWLLIIILFGWIWYI